ncbi:membrane protein [Agrobacterium sp. C13]|nr:membrane protein [Agrobacterium sp. TS45]KVK56904.1 membrane protein [Agrobacterium sp. C13]
MRVYLGITSASLHQNRRHTVSDISDYIVSHFKRSSREIGEVERRILELSHQKKLVSSDTNAEFSAGASFGDRLADNIAKVGGSWGFILGFCFFLIFWAIINTIILTTGAFDPYPFIFLNLLLSMLAAIQAPIIMMSQNRQAARDRFEAAKDYEVNLKAELEVLSLHEKIDVKVLAELAALRQDLAALHRHVTRKED